MYVKACPFNIFELAPKYGKILILTITVLIEIGIMTLQKKVGPKFFLPSCLRKKPYNFYKELEEDDVKNNRYNVKVHYKF